MNTNEPFIVEFETTNGNRYIYDVTTNCIFPSSNVTIEILNKYKKMTWSLYYWNRRWRSYVDY